MTTRRIMAEDKVAYKDRVEVMRHDLASRIEDVVPNCRRRWTRTHEFFRMPRGACDQRTWACAAGAYLSFALMKLTSESTYSGAIGPRNPAAVR